MEILFSEELKSVMILISEIKMDAARTVERNEDGPAQTLLLTILQSVSKYVETGSLLVLKYVTTIILTQKMDVLHFVKLNNIGSVTNLNQVFAHQFAETEC